MAQIEAHIVDAMTVAEKSIRSNYPPPFSELAGQIRVQGRSEPLKLHQTGFRAHSKRGVKRKASKPLPSALMPARKAELREGTWQWYQATARQHVALEVALWLQTLIDGHFSKFRPQITENQSGGYGNTKID